MHHGPATIVTFDRAGVRALDRAAIEAYGIPGIVLMENASCALEEAALGMLDGGGVVVCCGPGSNGGDGFALARRLLNRGVRVEIALVGERGQVSGDAGTNLSIAERMGIPVTAVSSDVGSVLDGLADRVGASLVVDALLGTGADRAVVGVMAEVVGWMNSRGIRVLSVDVPTGVDCDTGAVLGGGAGVAVRADVTVTLAGMKIGLRGCSLCGEVLVGDIGVPAALLVRLGLRAG